VRLEQKPWRRLRQARQRWAAYAARGSGLEDGGLVGGGLGGGGLEDGGLGGGGLGGGGLVDFGLGGGGLGGGGLEDGGPVGCGHSRARSWGPRRRARGDLRAGIRALHHAK
jgi:hypothetical protein